MQEKNAALLSILFIMDIQNSERLRVTCKDIVHHNGEHLVFKKEKGEKTLNSRRK